VRRLEKINTHGLVNLATSFLDVTPMTNDKMFGDFLDALLADPGVDCAFVAVVPHVENLKTTDAECRDEDAVASRLIAASRRHGKPVVVSVNAGIHYQGMVKHFEEGGLPVFSDIRSAITALDSFVGYHVRKGTEG
jgi:3-hydroxypropionyl-CoA synthetase (ADP-forming)